MAIDLNLKPIWPIIINESLKKRPLCEIVQKRSDLKIKYSSSTLSNTCILPKFSVAFLFLTDLDLRNEHSCTESVRQFVKVHRKAYVVAVCQPLDLKYVQAMSSIQLRLLTNPFALLFADDWDEAVDIMMGAAVSQSAAALASVEQSLAKFAEEAATEDTVLNILGHVGLSKHESTLLLDGCGSLSNLASANMEQLVEYGLDDTTIRDLREFILKDKFMF